jgi:hypothetical protein
VTDQQCPLPLDAEPDPGIGQGPVRPDLPAQFWKGATEGDPPIRHHPERSGP